MIGRIDEFTQFDEETSERGPLLGDSTVITLESRLSRMILNRFDHAQAGTQTLASIGITFSNGGQLTFDETTFREKYAENPQAVLSNCSRQKRLGSRPFSMRFLMD